MMLVDIAAINTGMLIGLLVRYVLIISLNPISRLSPLYTTPLTLWQESAKAYWSAAPLLTLMCLATLGMSGLYQPQRSYSSRRLIEITQATIAVFLLFAVSSYLITVLGKLTGLWQLRALSDSALLAGWAGTFLALASATQGAALWAAAREGHLSSPVIHNRYFLIGDLVLIALAAWLSFVVRLGAPDIHNLSFLVYLSTSLVVKPAIFHLFGLYRRYWRYASIGEVVIIVEANVLAVLGVILLALIIPIFFPFNQVPRSIPLIDLLLTTAGVGGIRFLVRLLGNRNAWSKLRSYSSDKLAKPCRVLIVGAGDAGAMIVREMQSSAQLHVQAVGFVDDDPTKLNMHILGVPILGTHPDLIPLINALRVSEVIVAMPSAPGKVIREVQRLCQQANVPCKVLPGIYELINGRISVSQLRPVRIDDLLRRDPVEIDQAALGQYLDRARILITGAGGSIGSELCRQVIRYNPLKLILLGHGENSIFTIERELRANFPDLDIEACIADVRDIQRLDQIFARYRPTVVFHAAAHKHVPLMEYNIQEAVTNNILGTQCVLTLAVKYNAKRFVLISTDKAVNPRSAMGASKRVAEMLVQDAARQAAGVFVAVRFGNVLGSRGSVVPLFQEQIAAGGPITITDPAMERFFMTIPEAVNLVLRAGTFGHSGAVYVLDMGAPVRIVDLAHDMIELSGLKPEDVEIRFIGTRPGEKIREELYMTDENMLPTPHPRIKMLRGVLNIDSDHLHRVIQDLISVARAGDEHETRTQLMELATTSASRQVVPTNPQGDQTTLQPESQATAAKFPSEYD